MICDFVCNVCGKQFKSKKTLTQHNRDVHIELDVPCSSCDKTFRTKKHLADHKLSKHTEKESLQCDVKSDDTECSYHTTSVSNLNAHKKRVHEKTVNAIQQLLFKFACSSCDFKTGTKYKLERHNAIKQTGETFHNESDEVVEQAHYRVNAFERIHGYPVSDRMMQTPNAAEKNNKE